MLVRIYGLEPNDSVKTRELWFPRVPCIGETVKTQTWLYYVISVTYDYSESGHFIGVRVMVVRGMDAFRREMRNLHLTGDASTV